MITVDLRCGWAMWRVDGATFDSFWWILNDKTGLEMQVGYVEGRCGVWDDESGLGMCGGGCESWSVCGATFNSVGWIWSDKSELVARVGFVEGIWGYI